MSGLRPQTRYTIRLSVLNGVSDQDSAGEDGRKSEVMATSGDISMYIASNPHSLCSANFGRAWFARINTEILGCLQVYSVFSY